MFLIRRDFTRVVAAFTLLAVGAGLAGLAQAQAVDQTLDKIDVSGASNVLGVKQTPVQSTVPYTLGNVSNLVFKNCQGTGTRGLYCLVTETTTSVQDVVVRWPDADDATPSAPRETMVKCDATIGLKNCTAMTVDLAGKITVAGETLPATPTTTPTYRIVQLALGAASTCPPGFAINTANPGPCYKVLAANRQLVSDLQAIDGEAGTNLRYGAGFLTLEGTNVGTGQPFFHPIGGGAPVELGRWNTANGESLSGVTLVQFRTVTPARNFVVASTTNGRVFAASIPATGTNIRGTATNLLLTQPLPPAVNCTTATAPVYRTRASVRTRATYFTRGSCAVGYAPILGNSLSFNTSPVLTQAIGFPVAGVSVSPGIEVDFVQDGCGTGTVNAAAYPTQGGCDLLGDGGDTNVFKAAKISGLQLAANSPSDWVMFQVKNLPDCRYLNPRPAICNGAVLNADGTVNNGGGDPTTQYLNIVPLLPPEVTQATFLPQEGMLIGPKFRARASLSNRSAPYRFDALFGIPEDGLTYKDTFQFTADIADLLGIPESEKLGCGPNGPLTNPELPPAWDVIVNVSERVPTVGGPKGVSIPAYVPNDEEYVAWLQNGDYCENPSGSISVRGSAFVYGLELAPREERSKPNGNKYWYWPDSTFALLMRSLAKDLNDHLYTYSCQALDAQGAPVSAANCYQLDKDWTVTYPKLTKCIDATDQPKNSAANEACNAFETQFGPFKAYVDALAATDPVLNDPNNRVGELKARVGILSATYFKQFRPSIKSGGFDDPNM